MLALSDSVDVRAESLTSVSENYITLQQTWDAAREATKDTEVRTRIAGVAAQMEKFEFFYGLELLLALRGSPCDTATGPSVWFRKEPFSACSLGLPSLVTIITTLM